MLGHSQLAEEGGGAPVQRAPDPGPKTSELDLTQLRNLPMRNWDDLMVNAMNHFGLDADATHAIGMEMCGAAGPRNAAQYAKTWNAVVTRCFQQAA